MNTGKILQKCRWEKNLSQEKLSRISGIPRQTIGSIELNKHSTSVAIFADLLNAMDYELIVAEKVKDGEQTQKYRTAKAVIDTTL